jgi:hypothetical protein
MAHRAPAIRRVRAQAPPYPDNNLRLYARIMDGSTSRPGRIAAGGGTMSSVSGICCLVVTHQAPRPATFIAQIKTGRATDTVAADRRISLRGIVQKSYVWELSRSSAFSAVNSGRGSLHATCRAHRRHSRRHPSSRCARRPIRPSAAMPLRRVTADAALSCIALKVTQLLGSKWGNLFIKPHRGTFARADQFN